MTFEAVKAEVEGLRKCFGRDVCTDAWEDGDFAYYVMMPGDEVGGYKKQFALKTGEYRHCGLGQGCFWSEWEKG